MSRILHLSEKKSILNPSPLFNAASHNDNTLLNTFIQSIYQSDAIPAEEKYEFIKIKRNGIPQLIRALSEGATSKMHCIVTTILQCDCMPDTDKVKLLSPNFGYNCTALNRCAIKGKADTLAIFTKTIIHSSLSIDHKVSLLSSTVLKPNEKSPAYHALLNGQTHTLAQFMSSILETKKLPTQQKMLLLTEKLDIKSGLTEAFNHSHTETIKTYLHLIINTDNKRVG